MKTSKKTSFKFGLLVFLCLSFGTLGLEAEDYEGVYDPIVKAVSPNTGPTCGGLWVTIAGERFHSVVDIQFGGVPSLAFSVVDLDTIIAIVPPREAGGTVDVVVTTDYGGIRSSRATGGSRFTYVNLQPGL